MNCRPLCLFSLLLLLLCALGAYSQENPGGTVFPVMTSSTVDSAKSKPGDKLLGKLMQDVVLTSGERIRAATRIEGQVVETSAGPGGGARVVVRFDRLIAGKKEFPIRVSLRALASMQDVFSAQLPEGTFDEYGTSISDWTTVQVGGAAVYLGDGTVRDAMEIVGRAPAWGIVTAKLMPAPKRGCAANTVEGEHEQSLWVFSPWACGTYGFDGMNIAHRGNTPPLGTIELTASAPFRVRGGSGWLLRAITTQAEISPSQGK